MKNERHVASKFMKLKFRKFVSFIVLHAFVMEYSIFVLIIQRFVCILNVNRFKAILWRIIRNPVVIIENDPLFVSSAFSLFSLTFNPYPTVIQYDHDFFLSSSEIETGVISTSSILDFVHVEK